MLKFVCLLLFAVAITNGSPVGDKIITALTHPDGNNASPAVEEPSPAIAVPNNEESLSGGDKDENLERSETFGFGYYPRFYGGWGGWGGGYGGWGYGGYHGYGPYGYGRGYYGGWRRPSIYWG